MDENHYYILNTNYNEDEADDTDMLIKEKAAAYYERKYLIEQLKKGDTVFLYRSGDGIVAMGIASGVLQKQPWHGDINEIDEEYFMKLDNFKRLLGTPLSPTQINEITGKNFKYRNAMFEMDSAAGRRLYDYCCALMHDNIKK